MPDRPAPDHLAVTLPAACTRLPVFALSDQYRRAVLGVYTDSTCLVAYVSGGVKGDVVYIKIGPDLGPLTTGRNINIYDASDTTNVCSMTVEQTWTSGSNHILMCRLNEPDDNGAGTDLNNADYVRSDDLYLTGYLMHAWLYNGAAVGAVTLYAQTQGMLASASFSPDLLDGNGTDPETDPIAYDASPDKPKFISGCQLYVTVAAVTTAGTILHLVFDPYCVQPTV